MLFGKIELQTKMTPKNIGNCEIFDELVGTGKNYRQIARKNEDFLNCLNDVKTKGFVRYMLEQYYYL